MFLVGTILSSPVKGLVRVFEEIRKAAREENTREKAEITEKLQHLYQQLAAEQITEEEFDTQEKVLLDRLDIINKSTL